MTQKEIDYLVSHAKICDIFFKMEKDFIEESGDKIYLIVAIRLGRELTEVDKEIIEELLLKEIGGK